MIWNNFAIDPISYQEAEPYPHIVLDDFLKEDLAKELLMEFPRVSDDWYDYDNPFEKKKALDKLDKLPINFQFALMSLNSGAFVKFLESMTGIKGLISDPHLRGGGLHQIERDGFLGVHEDFNYHQDLKLYRRLNVLIYFNREPKKSYGGELELWDKDMKECVRQIEPSFNRMVCFNTPNANHGHPNPWRGPSTRRSMALYYYSVEPADSDPHHSTMFKRRPSDAIDPALELLREQRNQGRLASNV